MTAQIVPWQEVYNSVITLSIAEQLQVLFALAKKLGFGDKLPASLNESDLYERSDSEDDIKQKTGSGHSVKCGDGELYSFLKIASTLNLDGPPDWSKNIDAYLYRGKPLDAEGQSDNIQSDNIQSAPTQQPKDKPQLILTI